MKGCRILLLCACAALPGLALAASTTGPQSLATVEGILDFCTKADPKDAAFFQAFKKNVSAGASQQDLDGIRGTGEYKNALGSLNGVLAKVSQKDAAKTCAAGVPPQPTHSVHGERRGNDSHPVRNGPRD